MVVAVNAFKDDSLSWWVCGRALAAGASAAASSMG